MQQGGFAVIPNSRWPCLRCTSGAVHGWGRLLHSYTDFCNLGTKLMNMLKQCGSFDQVELSLKRWKKNTMNTDQLGGWVTKHFLVTQKAYTKPLNLNYIWYRSIGSLRSTLRLRSMADRSFEFAKTQGLWRKNPVHGEEEARLVLEDTFKIGEEEGWQGEQSGSIDLPEAL